MNREELIDILNNYFGIGDSYTYELTREKAAYGAGTMTLDDFQEWDVQDTADLADYIFTHYAKAKAEQKSAIRNPFSREYWSTEEQAKVHKQSPELAYYLLTQANKNRKT